MISVSISVTRLRIGCAAYSYRKYLTTGKMTLEEFIKLGWELGLDGVELTAYYFQSTDDSYLYKLKRLLLSYGLDLSAAAVGNKFTLPDSTERMKEVEKVKRWVDIALKLGAPCLRVFAGGVPEGYSEEDAFNWTVSSLKECVKYAEAQGVVLALENHGGITSTASQVIRIIEAVNSDWLRVNLDLGNYRVDPYENMAKTAPYTVHVHAKIKKFSDKEEVIDYSKAVRILREAGYNGFLSIEYEGEEDPVTAIPRVVSFLRNILGK